MFLALISVFAQTATQLLTQAEIAFSDLSAAQGTRTAFLTYYSKRGITFEPGPGPGWDRWNARPIVKRRARLTWKPIFGLAAQSGDFGFNFGPTHVDEIATGKEIPNSAGVFCSVWHKEGNDWRVILDAGAPGATFPTDFAPVFEPGDRPDKPVTAEFLMEVDKANDAFTSETVWFRQGMPATKGAKNWRINKARTPMGAELAPSQDMGYVYGSVPGGYYHRIYQYKGGSWRVLVEVDLPSG